MCQCQVRDVTALPTARSAVAVCCECEDIDSNTTGCVSRDPSTTHSFSAFSSSFKPLFFYPLFLSFLSFLHLIVYIPFFVFVFLFFLQTVKNVNEVKQKEYTSRNSSTQRVNHVAFFDDTTNTMQDGSTSRPPH
jgi:hypothetical protein